MSITRISTSQSHGPAITLAMAALIPLILAPLIVAMGQPNGQDLPAPATAIATAGAATGQAFIA